MDARMRLVLIRDLRDRRLGLDLTVVEALVHTLDMGIFKSLGWE